ncbi:MAG TPA: thermonuclease family protein [Vicinamibacterales bacterium]|jgi:micrococcal nuclease|nr:thermonuclease family protein [Vicinamibacterales bacterium]
MQILPALVFAAGAIAQLLSLPTRSDPVLVRAVVDGDTIDVATLGRVRLLGIDAPELAHGYDTAAPFAREAKDRLAALVLNRFVRLEADGQRRDIYERRLAYVMREDGVFVNETLVREGLARVVARVPLARLPDLQRAEAEAQAFRRGMWGASPRLPEASGYTRRSGATKRAGVRIRKPRASSARSRKRKART